MAYKIWCGRVEKICLCTGKLKGPVKGLELSVVSLLNPYQEVEGSVLESR